MRLCGGVSACAGCSLFSYLGIVRHDDKERRVKMVCGEEMRRWFGVEETGGATRRGKGEMWVGDVDVPEAKSIDQEKLTEESGVGRKRPLVYYPIFWCQ